MEAQDSKPVTADVIRVVRREADRRVELWKFAIGLVVVLAPVFWQAAKTTERLDTIVVSLAKMEGYQRNVDLLGQKVEELEKDLERAQRGITKLDDRMAYRIANESVLRAYHPEAPIKGE